MILEHAFMNERAWAKQTTTGLIYGEALADFSGAYSGTWTICFAKYHGKFFSMKNYEAKFARGDSVLFVPFQQPVFNDSREAFLFSRGRYFRLGQVFEITAWTDKGIEGNVFVDDRGTPTNTPFNFDVPYRVYKQNFIIHGGKRTSLKKTLVYKGG